MNGHLEKRSMWEEINCLSKIKYYLKAIMLRRKIEKYFFCKIGVENKPNYRMVNNKMSAWNLQERELKGFK